MQEEMREENRR